MIDLSGTRKKVVFVNFSQTWGGGEKWHFEVAQELAKRGYLTEIFVNQGSALHKKALQAGLPHHAMRIGKNSFLNPLTFFRLVYRLKQLCPSAVILNGSIELKTAGVAAKYAHVPQIIYRRGLPRKVSPTIQNRLLFKHVVTDLIAISQFTFKAIEEIARLAGRPAPKIIYNGLDIVPGPQSNPYSKQIGIVGRLSYEKGVDLAIRAMGEIARRIPDAKMLIIGDGPERAGLEALTVQLNVKQNIQFIGFVDNVAEHLRACSLLALPSRWEGFGHVLLEAMLLKMPCVAFEQDSTREIIVPGVTGYLVEHENVHQLADVITKLLQQPETICSMGEAGYSRLITHFPLQKTIDELEQFLIKEL